MSKNKACPECGSANIMVLAVFREDSRQVMECQDCKHNWLYCPHYDREEIDLPYDGEFHKIVKCKVCGVVVSP